MLVIVGCGPPGNLPGTVGLDCVVEILGCLRQNG
jgi:hypothetical protein